MSFKTTDEIVDFILNSDRDLSTVAIKRVNQYQLAESSIHTFDPVWCGQSLLTTNVVNHLHSRVPSTVIVYSSCNALVMTVEWLFSQFSIDGVARQYDGFSKNKLCAFFYILGCDHVFNEDKCTSCGYCFS